MQSVFISFCLFAIISLCQAEDLDSEWENYKLQYNKIYKNVEEESLRKNIFENSWKLINQRNRQRMFRSFEIGVNEYSDLTDREFADIFLNSEIEDINVPAANITILSKYSRNAPDSVNWIEYGFKNQILNQGKCGSCYTFGAIAAMEAHHFIKTQKLIQLAHQEVMDCSMYLGNNGCSGGLTSQTFQYTLENGLGNAFNNPYLAKENVCQKSEPRFNINGYYQIEKGNEDDLKEIVSTLGPVAFGFDASAPTQSFRHYKSGIYFEPECTETRLSHAMTIVGYGSENGQDYWLVRNSWGESWGENGHIRVSRNKNNNCGIASRALYPVL